MSTRTDWGWFDKCGSPIAVGDAWHHWRCNQRTWSTPQYEHPITGEMFDGEPVLHPCPTTSLHAKCDECTQCGAQFRYP